MNAPKQITAKSALLSIGKYWIRKNLEEGKTQEEIKAMLALPETKAWFEEKARMIQAHGMEIV